MPKKLKEGTTPWDFSRSILSQNIEKIEGGPFGRFFFEKKSHKAEKFMLRGKRKNFFWFSSLGQKVQFDTIKFRRTYSSCGLKKVVAFHLMERRLKTEGNHPFVKVKFSGEVAVCRKPEVGTLWALKKSFSYSKPSEWGVSQYRKRQK